MIALERTVAVLLCGGQSRRFGVEDKLLYAVKGRPLVAHAAEMLAALPFFGRIATVRAGAPDLEVLLAEHGFATVGIGEDDDQRQSLEHGLAAAFAIEPNAILLALGDMPFVTSGHFLGLAEAASDEVPAASHGEGWVGPPWLASVNWVRQHRGDLKAALAREAVAIAPPSTELADIDRVEDLG